MMTLITETGSHPDISGGVFEDIAQAQIEMDRGIMPAPYLIPCRRLPKQAQLSGYWA